mmetsp:Transcript_48884/g.137918  ORF Transcript_48884/g.137918 Transcript_48884/m.137918 type:complete len:207 (+) Transcript_48884:4235-4855(+)
MTGGAVFHNVIWCCSIRLSQCSGNFSWSGSGITIAPPAMARMPKRSNTDRSNESEAKDSTRSELVMPYRSTQSMQVFDAPSCLMVTPLGTPVEPEVKMMYAVRISSLGLARSILLRRCNTSCITSCAALPAASVSASRSLLFCRFRGLSAAVRPRPISRSIRWIRCHTSPFSYGSAASLVVRITFASTMSTICRMRSSGQEVLNGT